MERLGKDLEGRTDINYYQEVALASQKETKKITEIITSCQYSMITIVTRKVMSIVMLD
jgi:hypothetical protein